VTSTSPSASHDHRASAFARLFDKVHEGIYVGLLAVRPEDGDTTLLVNACLRELFVYAASRPHSEIQPFGARFTDPAERACLIERLRTSREVCAYPMRVRRADGRDIVVEITGSAVAVDDRHITADLLVRDAAAR
jgi:hypothetical protein